MSGLLHVDTGRLDVELREIPQAIHDNAVKMANCKAAVETATNAFKFLEAKKSAEVRGNPVAFGLPEKPTVGAVDGAVLELPEIQDAKSAIQQANYALDLCWAIQNGLNAKREALVQLVRLFLNDYYSSPQPHETEAAEAASNKVVEQEKAAAHVADAPKPKGKPGRKKKEEPEESRADDIGTGGDVPPGGTDGW